MYILNMTQLLVKSIDKLNQRWITQNNLKIDEIKRKIIIANLIDMQKHSRCANRLMTPRNI